MTKIVATPEPLSIAALVLDLSLAFLLSAIVAWYYARFAETLSNRVKFAKQLPFLSLTTVLVISVVKSSLALSLGLVGALSIVRFRTAIKEPEELLYLFLAIAIGLGMGADQRVPTLVAVGIIFLLLLGSTILRPKLHRRNLYVNIQVPAGGENGGVSFSAVNDILATHASFVDMRRLEKQPSWLQMTYFLDCKNQESLAALMDDLQARVPGCTFNFVEQSNMPGV